MKKVFVLLLVTFLTVSLFGCTNASSKKPVKKEPQRTETSQKPNNAIVYHNTQYGFDFALPTSWKGYKIVADKWEGVPIGGEKVVETGPMISIRHPAWTAKIPRQDIPIMVFTLAQWKSLQEEKFHIGAAPMGPSELGRNKNYVFALPARYNYAFPTGYKEVENILKTHPLTAK
ncbi:MAG: hypothetical protein ACM3PP_13115 [Candidatus Saccharibacteria bacterium]